MAFNLSPSVTWAEQDYSLVAISQVDTIGGIAVNAAWGPVMDPQLILGGEDEYVQKFYKPNDDTYRSFFTATDYFSYSKKAWVVRQVGTSARNSVEPSVAAALIKNDDEWEGVDHTYRFVGRYPGTLLNGLSVEVTDKAGFATWDHKGAFDYAPGDGQFNVVLVDRLGTIQGTGEVKQVDTLTLTGTSTGTAFTLDIDGATKALAITNGQNIATHTASQNAVATALKALSEIDDVVSNGDGTFTVTWAVGLGHAITQTGGNPTVGITAAVATTRKARRGTILEQWHQLSNTSTAKRSDGSSAYAPNVITQQSRFLRLGTSAGIAKGAFILQGGVSDDGTVAAPLTNMTPAFKELENAEKLDVNFIIAGPVATDVQQAISDICGTRRDCMGFYSPQFADVVNNRGNEVKDVLAWRGSEFNKASSYDVIDCNWAQVYDQYNDKKRWIPTCGGTAGLLARTYYTDAPWVSPAFHTRGRYKNYLRLAWSPFKEQRDELYKNQVNPVIDLTGEGKLLYGDKTGTPIDSAFNRINVRSLFITVEKTIANLAKYYLGEVNDEFTRTQFLNVVIPYLRDVKARRGIEDFKVICDERNNTAQVRASNEMRAQILIKPLYSINFIKLDFAAVRPDISFEELEGQLF